MNFRLEQPVRVHPKTWLLRRYSGWLGTVDTVEMEADGQWTYRVKFQDEPGQGYPYYASELEAISLRG